MLKNYLKVALRNARRQKAFAFINIAGLSLAGGVALLLALLTVSTQAVKAALANPVEALRYE